MRERPMVAYIVSTLRSKIMVFCIQNRNSSIPLRRNSCLFWESNYKKKDVSHRIQNGYIQTAYTKSNS